MNIHPLPQRSMTAWRRWLWRTLGFAVLAYLPFVLSERSILGVSLSNTQLLNLSLTQINLMLIAMLGALSLTFLTGCAGLISIGHAALYAIGAMTAATTGALWGWPFGAGLLAAAFTGALAGLVAGLPSLRVRGLYFVLSTMALHYIVVYAFLEFQFKFFDVVGIPYPLASLGAWELNTPMRWYFFLLPTVAAVYLGFKNILSHREGQALKAMRDHELAAASMGVHVSVLRIKAFMLSSSIASVAGALYAHYLTNVTSEAFGIGFAIQFIAMIIVGGMGSLGGSMWGAGVWLLLPSVIQLIAAQASETTGLVHWVLVENKAQLVQLIFGSLVVALLIFAPAGLAGLAEKWRNSRHAKQDSRDE
jgi:branched-chain amino acid transport system permease protein